MPRYTAEVKTKALEMLGEVSAKKVSEELGISYATILNWKSEAKTKPNVNASDLNQPETRELVEDASANQETQECEGISLSEQVRTLKNENASLVQENARLKAAIMSLIKN